MKFSNFLSLFGGIIPAVVGVEYWINERDILTTWGFVITWQTISLLMFIFSECHRNR